MRRIVLLTTGIALVIAAVVALARGGVPYEDSQTLEFSVPPLVAGLGLVVGGGLVFAGARSGR